MLPTTCHTGPLVHWSTGPSVLWYLFSLILITLLLSFDMKLIDGAKWCFVVCTIVRVSTHLLLLWWLVCPPKMPGNELCANAFPQQVCRCKRGHPDPLFHPCSHSYYNFITSFCCCNNSCCAIPYRNSCTCAPFHLRHNDILVCSRYCHSNCGILIKIYGSVCYICMCRRFHASVCVSVCSKKLCGTTRTICGLSWQWPAVSTFFGGLL